MKFSNCPVCKGVSFTSVLSLGQLPIAINAQVTRSSAPAVKCGDIDLVICNSCSHMFNLAFDESKVGYNETYENSLHYSPHFRRFANQLATRLVEDHGLVGGAVVEAGSGPGHFLSLLCEAGVSEAVGYDPSYDSARLEAPSHPAVKLTQGFLPGDGEIQADLALSQHVLEHLMDPVSLLQQLAGCIREAEHGAVYSEVPNGELMLDSCALWDLIYEHCSYFTPLSLTCAAGKAGLSEHHIEAIYDRQFLSLDSLTCEPISDLPEASKVDQMVEKAIEFGNTARSRIELARDELESYRKQGPVVLWGAGSKGMTYMNLVSADGLIDTVVDVNPRKAGCGVPGVDAVIGMPDIVLDVMPKTVLVSNPVYVSEIESTLDDLGMQPAVKALWG